MKSIEADQQRSDNMRYMNDNQLNSSEELKGVIHERIQAERELAEAMRPVNAALLDMDIGLTKFKTALVRFITGKEADGTDTTSEQRATSLATAGGADGIITLPSQGTTPITEQMRLDAHAADPVSRFWNNLFGGNDPKEAAEENRTRWSDVKVPEKDLFGLNQIALKLENVFKELDAGDMTDGTFRRFRPDALEGFDASSAMKRAQGQSEVNYPTLVQDVSEAPKEVVTNNINVPAVTVNVTAKTDASPEQIAKASQEAFKQGLSQALQNTNAQLGSEIE
jgi:hypothetical protein